MRPLSEKDAAPINPLSRTKRTRNHLPYKEPLWMQIWVHRSCTWGLQGSRDSYTGPKGHDNNQGLFIKNTSGQISYWQIVVFVFRAPLSLTQSKRLPSKAPQELFIINTSGKMAYWQFVVFVFRAPIGLTQSKKHL